MEEKAVLKADVVSETIGSEFLSTIRNLDDVKPLLYIFIWEEP